MGRASGDAESNQEAAAAAAVAAAAVAAAAAITDSHGLISRKGNNA